MNYIDLFAGCGGLSLGLHNAGWKGIFAVEKSPDAFSTLKHNLIDKKNHFEWPDWLPIENLEINKVLSDFSEQLKALQGTIDLVAGGPPCQGFSSAGRRKEEDVRNGLIKSYLRFIMYVRPKMIFFENVKGFTSEFKKNKSKGKVYSEYVQRVLNFFGYKVKGQMVDFSKFGIPQKRTRFILVGIRKDSRIDPNDFFKVLIRGKKKFLKDRKLPQNPNLSNAISDLLKKNGTKTTQDRKGFLSGKYSKGANRYQNFLKKGSSNNIPDSHSFPKHNAETIERFKFYLKARNNNKNIAETAKAIFDINKHCIRPLSPNLPAPTLTTLPDDYIHYSEPRIFTVREYARIQSFPDWYEFLGKYTTGGKLRKLEVPRYTQIGNAIPPLFSEQSGLVLKKLLK